MTNLLIATTAAGALTAYLAAYLVATLIARAGFRLPATDRRFGCIDGLRGALALSVLIHHFILWMQVSRLGGAWTAPVVNLFNQIGASSVALFFMTTGFVFYPRVLAGFRACRWPAIYVTRLFRIVPLVAVSVAVMTAIVALRTGHGLDRDWPLAALQWISTWNMPPLLGYPDSGRLNAYVLWSLWYEWLFYVFVLPACALAMDLIRGRLPSWTLPVALLAIALIGQALHPGVSLLTFLPLFAIGMLAHECQAREPLARRLRGTGGMIIALLALVVGLNAFPTPYTLAMPLLGVFFVCVACGNSLGGLLHRPATLVLGHASYGIYLLHGIVLNVLFVDATALTGTIPVVLLPLVMPLAAIATTLVAVVTYLAVEHPAIELGRWIAGRWGRRLRDGAAELEVAP